MNGREALRQQWRANGWYADATIGDAIADGARSFPDGRIVFEQADGDVIDLTLPVLAERIRTGDQGRVDADGFLTITDRVKDIIIRGGENISAREVEDVLAEHPLVDEVAVCAAPDAIFGEVVCAFVRLRPSVDPLTLDALRTFAADAGLASHKLPERLVVVDDFPRTAAGKVRKRDLRPQLPER